METPCDKSGSTTEIIMIIIKQVLPKIETSEYNKIYGAVYNILKERYEN